MASSEPTDSPLEAAAGAAGPGTTDAFKLLSNETRLAVLLALWEAYDPFAVQNAVSFSELYDRVGVSDSGNFTYHLDQLTGHFVRETDDGYELGEAGLKIVQAVIAGTGLEEATLPATEVDMSCVHCEAPVEISYEDQRAFLKCTSCEGSYGPESPNPTGTIQAHNFNPAGLTQRSPEEVFVAETIEFLKQFELQLRGICPECSGPVDDWLHICEDHRPEGGRACPTCGTQYEVSVNYVCSVCKHRGHAVAQAAVHDHPAVVAFCYEHGIEQTFDLESPSACGRLWAHLFDRDYVVVSEDPVRVRITVPGDGEELQLTIDEDLDVVDVSRTAG